VIDKNSAGWLLAKEIVLNKDNVETGFHRWDDTDPPARNRGDFS